MGVVEARRVLESVAQHAVEAHVSQPDSGQAQEQRIAEECAAHRQAQAAHGGMGGVVGQHASTRTPEERQQAEVRDEEQRRRHAPAPPGMDMQEDRRGKQCRALEPQQDQDA